MHRALLVAAISIALVAPGVLVPAPSSDAFDHVQRALDARPAPADAMGLREAVEAFDARLGVERAPGELGVLATLDPALEEPLAALLSALYQGQLARDAVYAGIDEQTLLALVGHEADPAAAQLARIDTLALRAAALRILATVEDVLPVLRAPTLAVAPHLAAAPPLVDLAPVLVVDPLGVANVYAKDAVLSVDLGGDDVYDNSAGGSIIAQGPVGDPSTFGPTVGGLTIGGEFEDSVMAFTASLALDVAGNDAYGVLKPPRPGSRDAQCAREPIIREVVIQGSGSGGIGILVDAQGHDVYRGKTLAQGNGHLGGVGVLVDLLGDDDYFAIRSSQGSGVLFGSGVLVDADGDDEHVFRAPLGGLFNVDAGRCDATARLGLGAGVMTSTGHFVDLDGVDTYRIGTQSFGEGTAQGVGSFVDAGGADDYGGAPGVGNDVTAQRGNGVFVDAAS